MMIGLKSLDLRKTININNFFLFWTKTSINIYYRDLIIYNDIIELIFNFNIPNYL